MPFRNLKFKIFATLLLLFSIWNGTSWANEKTKILVQIRQMIERGNYGLAFENIDLFLKENPGDDTIVPEMALLIKNNIHSRKDQEKLIHYGNLILNKFNHRKGYRGVASGYLAQIYFRNKDWQNAKNYAEYFFKEFPNSKPWIKFFRQTHYQWDGYEINRILQKAKSNLFYETLVRTAQDSASQALLFFITIFVSLGFLFYRLLWGEEPKAEIPFRNISQKIEAPNSITIFILSLLLFTSFSCQSSNVSQSSSIIEKLQEPRSEYFRKYSLNGRYEIQGRYPIETHLQGKVSGYRFDYDKYNRIHQVNFSEGPILDPVYSEMGADIMKIKYLLNYEERSFYRKEGKQRSHKWRNVFLLRIQKDKNGNPITLSYHNIIGGIVENRLGVARHNWALDAKGRIIKETYENANGEKMPMNSHFQTIKGKYNRKLVKGDRYEKRWQYDEHDNVLKETIYKEIFSIPYAFSSTRYRYDEKGNKIEERYFGQWDKPKAENKMLVSEQYDESKGKIISNIENGPFKRTFEYDSYGNLILTQDFGEDDKAISNPNNSGISKVKKIYDERGNTLETQIQGKTPAAPVDEGFYKVTTTHDYEKGTAEHRFWDKDGNLVSPVLYGAPIKRAKFDKNKNLTEISLHDKDGNLMNGYPKGEGGKYFDGEMPKYAIYRWFYDENGKFTKSEAYDKEGNVIDEKRLLP